MTVQASEKSEVEEEERRGDGPVDIARPEEVSVDVLDVQVVGDLVPVLVLDVLDVDAVAGRHGEVGDEGGGGDEGGNDVEETLLLLLVLVCVSASIVRMLSAYDWESPGHADESNGGEGHESGNDHQESVTMVSNDLVGWLIDDSGL